MILHVLEAEVCGPHHLRVRFNDGVTKRIDLGPLLHGPIFEPLRDPEYFAKVELDEDFGAIQWPNGADFAPEALHALEDINSTPSSSRLSGGGPLGVHDEDNFVQKCLAGETLADDIGDFVARYHAGEGDPNASLADFLGFTDLEYRLWEEKPHLLQFILNAKRGGVSLEDARNYDDSYRIAARGLSAEDVEELTRWLKETGEIPS